MRRREKGDIRAIAKCIDRVMCEGSSGKCAMFRVRRSSNRIAYIKDLGCVGRKRLLRVRKRCIGRGICNGRLGVSRCGMGRPRSVISVRQCLNSKTIGNINTTLTNQVIGGFGRSAFHVVRRRPRELTRVGKVDREGTRRVTSRLRRGGSVQGTVVCLRGCNVSAGLTTGVCRCCKVGICGILRRGPCRLTSGVRKVKFGATSRVTSGVNVRASSSCHVQDNLFCALRRTMNRKRICLPRGVLLQETGTLLKISLRSVRGCVVSLYVRQGAIVGRISRRVHVCPTRCCCLRLGATGVLGSLSVSYRVPRSVVRGHLGEMRRGRGVRLSPVRRETIVRTVGRNLLVLAKKPNANGAAAVGAVVRFFRDRKVDVLLTTPAKHTTGQVARTAKCRTRAVRELLRMDKGPRRRGDMNKFLEGERGPLRASIVVVSRVSVISLGLVRTLLSTIVPKAELVLIKSISRLPSIKPKDILGSVVHSRGFRMIALAGVFHRTKRDSVMMGTRGVGTKRPIAVSGGDQSFFFLGHRSTGAVVDIIVALVRGGLPECIRTSPGRVRMVAPAHGKLLNMRQLGIVLRRCLGPSSSRGARGRVGNELFHRNSGMVRVGGGCRLR